MTTLRRCEHLDLVQRVAPSSWGCTDCLAAGHRGWVHLRLCMTCGHVGCCDSSPRRHARAHFLLAGHPIVRSYEPGERWFYCYADDLMFEVEGAPPSASHP
ncbi:MAG: UBP-type zinc finger domain-containing protein [Actinomycetota bacterium]